MGGSASRRDRRVAELPLNVDTTESFYGHLEDSFLKSAPAATEAAIREAALSAPEP
jgi:hypothetical protein